MKYKILTTNYGDSYEESRERLLKALEDGWEIITSDYIGHGLVDYVLTKDL